MQPSEQPTEAPSEPPMEGMGWRVSLSIAVSIGWLIFLIVWLFFYAGKYSPYKNVALILASLLVLGALLGIPWAIWGRRYMKPEDREQMHKPGFRWRMWTSGIVSLIIFIGLIYWFFTYADTYTIYQNIAIIIVALLLMGGIMGAMWAPWGMKYGKKQ